MTRRKASRSAEGQRWGCSRRNSDRKKRKDVTVGVSVFPGGGEWCFPSTSETEAETSGVQDHSQPQSVPSPPGLCEVFSQEVF